MLTETSVEDHLLALSGMVDAQGLQPDSPLPVKSWVIQEAARLVSTALQSPVEQPAPPVEPGASSELDSLLFSLGEAFISDTELSEGAVIDRLILEHKRIWKRMGETLGGVRRHVEGVGNVFAVQVHKDVDQDLLRVWSRASSVNSNDAGMVMAMSPLTLHPSERWFAFNGDWVVFAEDDLVSPFVLAGSDLAPKPDLVVL